MLKNITKYAAVAVVAAASIFATSCKKDKEPANNPAGGSRQLIKVEQGATLTTSFEYNADSKLSKMITKEGQVSNTVDFTYGADKKLATINSSILQLKFIYTTGALSKVEYYATLPQLKLTSYVDFVNQNGKVKESKVFAVIDQTTIAGDKTTFTYNAAGDVATSSQYQWNAVQNAYVLEQTTTYEYDGKTNPLAITAEFAQAFGGAISSHNITKEVVRNAQEQVIETNVYAYTFDDKGYPVTATQKTTTKENPNEVTTTLKFTYKN